MSINGIEIRALSRKGRGRSFVCISLVFRWRTPVNHDAVLRDRRHAFIVGWEETRFLGRIVLLHYRQAGAICDTARRKTRQEEQTLSAFWNKCQNLRRLKRSQIFLPVTQLVHVWRDSLIIRGMFRNSTRKYFYEFYRQFNILSLFSLSLFLQNSRIFLDYKEPLYLFIRAPCRNNVNYIYEKSFLLDFHNACNMS